ncbi:MAG: hypothetical protein QXS21_01270 [Thermoproteota archaeon]|nr:hypothetical protein [Candidatus Brockarchaeota archaeon]MBO3768134.1 hypothetical protein [Candidatus Brockarchaeota archaeon]MBO3801341.1 hypothetical protein [Candidatus Brockarchaeota archaeon]
MEGEFEKNFNRFLKLNPDLGGLLQKIDQGKIEGTYYAGKIIRNGRSGYILRIKLFVPLSVRSRKLSSHNKIKLSEITVNNNVARVIVSVPLEHIDEEHISYDGFWLTFRLRKKKYRVFVGLPLNWNKRKINLNNGVLEVTSRIKTSNLKLKLSP